MFSTKGIKIVLPSLSCGVETKNFDSTRIELSNGIESVDGTLPNYMPDAHVPRLPWRPCTDSERDTLIGNSNDAELDFHNSVRTISFPHYLLAPTLDLFFSHSLMKASNHIT